MTNLSVLKMSQEHSERLVLSPGKAMIINKDLDY